MKKFRLYVKPVIGNGGDADVWIDSTKGVISGFRRRGA
jgi:hypothetical protein